MPTTVLYWYTDISALYQIYSLLCTLYTVTVAKKMVNLPEARVSLNLERYFTDKHMLCIAASFISQACNHYVSKDGYPVES